MFGEVQSKRTQAKSTQTCVMLQMFRNRPYTNHSDLSQDISIHQHMIIYNMATLIKPQSAKTAARSLNKREKRLPYKSL